MHCWVCDFSSKNLIPILIKFSNNFLLETYKTKFLNSDSTNNSIECEQKISLPHDFNLLVSNSFDPDAKQLKNYLISREITINQLWYFKLGFSNVGKLRRRVIIPSFDNDGNLNYYTARSIDASNRPKYINPKVNRYDIIFNELNIDFSNELTITEGPFDLIKCNENATCLLGCQLSERSLLFTKILENSTPIVLALDSDKFKLQDNIAKKLQSYGIETKILPLNGYSDVGEMKKKDFNIQYKNRYLWNKKISLKSKIKAIQSKNII